MPEDSANMEFKWCVVPQVLHSYDRSANRHPSRRFVAFRWDTPESWTPRIIDYTQALSSRSHYLFTPWSDDFDKKTTLEFTSNL